MYLDSSLIFEWTVAEGAPRCFAVVVEVVSLEKFIHCRRRQVCPRLPGVMLGWISAPSDFEFALTMLPPSVEDAINQEPSSPFASPLMALEAVCVEKHFATPDMRACMLTYGLEFAHGCSWDAPLLPEMDHFCLVSIYGHVRIYF